MQHYAAHLDTLSSPGIRRVGLFGDSHIRTLFSQCANAYVAFQLQADLYPIRAATITGFGKRVSTLNYFEKIALYADVVAPEALFLKFGQVDLELGYYYRRVIKKERFDDQSFFDAIIERYTEAAKSLTAFAPVFILGINLPTIPNHKDAVRYFSKIIFENCDTPTLRKRHTKKLSEILHSYTIRLQRALDFNTSLSTASSRHNLPFIDTTTLFYSDTLQEHLYGRTPGGNADHHYKTTENDKRLATRYILSQAFGEPATTSQPCPCGASAPDTPLTGTSSCSHRI